MPDIDELLHRELSALQNGTPLETVLANLPEESRPLEPLIRLAAAVQTLPHPDPLLEQSNFRQRKLLESGREMQRARQNRTAAAPRRFQWPTLRWILVPALAGAMVLLLVASVSLVGLGLWMTAPRGAQAATLMDVAGQVEVASRADASDWQVVSNGDIVYSGQRIRTSGASGVTLVFFEGSRTTLGSNADVTLSRVDGDRGKVLRVVLTQNTGKTSHSVVPLKGKKSSFMVFTPSGAASVHGTTFNVAVGANGKSRFAVNTGKVLVTNDASEVYLTAGQVTAAQQGDALETPAYQFSLQGVLSANQGSTWIVDGVPFTVLEGTQISGNPQVGDEIIVEGRVEALGDWVAENITPAVDTEKISTFTGVLQSMDGDTWEVGGWTVLVNGETDLGEGLEVGLPVRVTFNLLEDGRWQAVSIQALQEADDEPTATPIPTADPEAQPELSFDPDELQLAACPTDSGSSYSVTGTLRNTASEAGDAAANVKLGYQITSGAEYVDSVALSPSGWASFAAGEQASFNVTLALNVQDWQSVPEGTEIKLRVFVAEETNRPDGYDTRLTVTLVAECAEVEETTPAPDSTETPTVTATPTITETETVTPTVTATPTITVTETLTPTVTATPEPTSAPEAGVCTGAQPHPTGTTLALRYGVPYEEIMIWFCQGFGFGEIDHAYSLSLESGMPVASIFEMKLSGMGWGEIKQQLSPKQPNPNKPDKNNPGNGGPGNGNQGGNNGPGNVQPTPEPGSSQTGNGKPPHPTKPPKKNK